MTLPILSIIVLKSPVVSSNIIGLSILESIAYLLIARLLGRPSTKFSRFSPRKIKRTEKISFLSAPYIVSQ
ncbi:hypothetical protein N7492_006349 [Penicillium capsulatum]|uniref:Uncharacterized protein n=1 Tax=Penicillium capsulatum TaxID=69766 RepID=A0A9W9I3D2_9EURO|nr:hypothetical protein N7492_006349 [Penicillium capsulatum]KAJ6108998.1 hypothetical protein N7512_008835 [Penicillium capsulatum]